MFNYTQSAATALRLIKQFGGAVPIKRKANVYDPVTGATVQSETTGTLQAAVLPLKQGQGQFSDQITEAIIKGRARLLLVAASGLTIVPDVEDLVTFEGASWRVFGCTPLSPAGTPVLYKVGVMKQ